MNKRRLLIAAALLGIGALAAWLALNYANSEDKRGAYTEADIREAMRKMGGTESPAPTAPPPLDMSRLLRFAVGGLGLVEEEQNRRLGDLIVTELSGARGLDLVDRQSLGQALREMELNLSSLVRAKDVIRAGKLLRADWFLLGSPVTLNGTNYVVARIVDAKTGVVREAGAFAAQAATPKLAAELAHFVRLSRQNAAEAKVGVYLSIGSFEDFSLNSRREDLPTQLRSYLTAAYRQTNITFLEREFASTLLDEMQLGLASLTDDAATNLATMQSAYWMADGYYQSYENSEVEVELILSVRRMFGRSQQFTLRAKPGEPLFRRVKDTLDDAMQRDRAAVLVSRATELRASFAAGKEIFHAGRDSFHGTDLIWLHSDYSGIPVSENQIARQRRNIEEAIRAFQTVLLLDPNHREAKLYLAACFRQFFIGRTDEARSLYRELIEGGVNDPLTTMACQALEESLRHDSAEERLRWFEAANGAHLHSFYQSQIKAAREQIALARKGTTEAQIVAERKLFEAIAKWERDARQGMWMGNLGPMGFEDYVKAFGTNRARGAAGLTGLLPKMLTTSSNMVPYVIAGTLIYQVDTNAPVVAQFERSLEDAVAHPERLFGSKQYFSMVSREVHNWAVAQQLHALAARTKEVRASMAMQKFAEPLTDDDKMGLAFTFLRAEAWQQALEVFQSYSNRPVARGFSGVSKGAFMPVFTGQQANYCRKKLGLPVQLNSHEFTMGTNCLCMHGESTFQTDSGGLWVATGDQLLRLDFELKTNFSVSLATDEPITVLLPTGSNVWVGTDGGGLIEFDIASRQSRRLTMKDGLMMDAISALHLAGDSLWIGYGGSEGGGLGRLHLATRAVRSFTLSLAGGTEAQRNPIGNLAFEPFDKPPRRKIQALASGPGGTICFSTVYQPLRRYQPDDDKWSVCPLGSGNSVVADSKRLFVGSAGDSRALGVTAWDFESNKVWGFEEAEGLPRQQVSTLTLDGENLWVGGFGFVAVTDARSGKVRKLAYVPALTVDRIQLDGGYVWVQFDKHLHRARLADLQ